MPRNQTVRKKIGALNQKVVKLYQQGKYRQALAAARDAVKLAKAQLGLEYPETAVADLRQSAKDRSLEELIDWALKGEG